MQLPEDFYPNEGFTLRRLSKWVADKGIPASIEMTFEQEFCYRSLLSPECMNYEHVTYMGIPINPTVLESGKGVKIYNHSLHRDKIDIQIEIKKSGSTADYFSAIGDQNRLSVEWHPQGMSSRKVLTLDREELDDLLAVLTAYKYRLNQYDLLID